MKYLLDTDVVSQYTKPAPNRHVDLWLERTDDRDLYLCEVTFAELWYGIHLLPNGKKRASLEQWLEDDLYMQFFNRIVFFDLNVARHYGILMAQTRRKGFSPGAMDALVASIAITNGMTVATLNRKDFEPFGVNLVDF